MTKVLTKKEYKNLNEDKQQLYHLENMRIKILECKENIDNNIYHLGMYLSSVKEQLAHGEFGKWLNINVGFGERTARNFMKAYKFQNDFTMCENIEESDEKEQLIANFNKGQLMELSTLNKKDADIFINKDTVAELKDLSMEKLKSKIKEFKQSKKNETESKTESTCRFENITVGNSTIVDNLSLEIQTETINKVLKALDDTLNLFTQLRNRTDSDESISATLVARYEAKEITFKEISAIIQQEKYDLPIFFKEELFLEYIYDKCNHDLYSDYSRYDNNLDVKADRTYYSLFDRELEWQEVIRCWDIDNENAIDWSKNNHVDNKTYQLAKSYIDNSKYLCIYKDYKLKGTFIDGDLDSIQALCKYDNDLDYSILSKLYKTLESQMTELNKRQEKRDKIENEKRKIRQAQQKKYDDVLREWKECYQPYSMGKYKFEDIYNEETGEIKNYKLWREMCDFVREEKQEKYDKWKNYNWGDMFGGSSSIAVKEEDKPMYKKIYKTLALNYHPDKGGSLEDMQFVNKLKENWGI